MDPLDVRRTRPAESNVKEPTRETGLQTAGPYVHIGCLPNFVGIKGVYENDLTHNRNIQESDEIVRIHGWVFEGDKIPGKDIMLEFWQADENGDYSKGIWHRAGTDLQTGRFEIETVMPGPVDLGDGDKLAPFISIWIVARGINIGLLTRMYFPEQETLNSADPHLALVDASRRSTLVSTKTENPGEYRFDIHLQGDAETVFFDV